MRRHRLLRAYRTMAWDTLLFLHLLALAVVGPAAPTLAGPSVLDTYDELLARYVTPEGVRYADWRENPEDLEALSQVLVEFSSTDPGTLAASERFALYINLYNAKVLEIVLKEMPMGSIRDLSMGLFGYEIFFRKLIPFDGKVISLNKLEKRLRKKSGDPRIHFAVNCASKSCPPIAARGYRGERLDQQLEMSTRDFLALPGAIEIETTSKPGRPVLQVRVSKVFKWYAGDFKPVGGVIAFLEKYAPSEIAEQLKQSNARVNLSYQDYDWSLNSTHWSLASN